MKKVLFALGVVAISWPALAQEHAHNDNHNYEISVFDGYNQLKFPNQEAAAVTRQKAASVFPGFIIGTDKLSGQVKDIYGKTMQVTGASITDKVNALMNNQLQSLGIDKAQWRQMKVTNAPHATYAYYEQYIDGRKVIFSQMNFRFTNDGKLQRITVKTYGQPQPNTIPGMSRVAVLNTPAMGQELSAIMNVKGKDVGNDWVWFPVPNNTGYRMVAAWPFSISGNDRVDDAMPVALNGYIDAANGTVLYRENDVKEDINLVVKGNVYKSGFLAPATTEPLSNLAITVGANTYYTNDTGFFSINTLSPVQTVNVKLAGLWSTVYTAATGGTVPTFSKQITTNGTTYIFPATTPSSDAHVNAYYHTNRMHDFMKKFYPNGSGFTGLDISLATNVDVVSSTGCNAFYNGNSINFYAENAGCNSFAKIGDIIYHEYGHGINGKFYSFIKGGGGMSNGGLNEGYADVWALCLTKDPVLGKGAFKSGGNIRTYTGAPKVYPMDVTSEVHANGEIIAGAWWDVGINMGEVDSMAKVFAKTLYDVPDGPEGTEGDVYHEVLVSAIINDDNDGDLSNGTPHFTEIIKGFARHGIYLMSDAKLDHKEIDHQQSETSPIQVTANITVTEPAFFQSLKLVYRNRTAANWDTVALNNGGSAATGGIAFTGTIPAQQSGTIVEYYFLVIDRAGIPGYSFPNAFSPALDATKVTIPYQFAVGITTKILGTDFETAAIDWELTNTTDNATSGIWAQEKPVQSTWRPSGLSLISQTGGDHTSGSGMCMVTGNAASSSTDYNSADVDNGKTTVTSPVFDISAFSNPVIEYYRWFANDRGGRDSNPRTDMWKSEMRDKNSSIWRTVEMTNQSDYEWRRKVFLVRDYLTTSTEIQIRFIARDDVNSGLTGNGQNNVEGAVDDIFIYDASPTSVNSIPQRIAMQVYPNPANDVVMVSLPAGVAGSLSLHDLSGRVITSQKMDAATLTYSFNTASLAAGQYMLMIKTEKSLQSQNIVVKH